MEWTGIRIPRHETKNEPDHKLYKHIYHPFFGQSHILYSVEWEGIIPVRFDMITVREKRKYAKFGDFYTGKQALIDLEKYHKNK